MVNLFGETENDMGALVIPAVETGGAAYRVLARKYRPTKFSELIGQDALVRTLTNAFASGRLAHAWMMTGVRGVGKTTTARIIARALNCTGDPKITGGTGGPTIEPCGICPTCVAIAEDRCVDVTEMDAATHTGIENMREVMDGMRYAPVMARTKVYIIDEVHQLSKHTFNALLKTLEEPPPHVKFVFATTEIRKVPVTVLSRCQRFDLRRVPADTLTTHFADVCNREGVPAEDAALRLIARAADGSVRDGLSLLDQAMSRIGAEETAITVVAVQDMLGLSDRTQLVELMAAITEGDAPTTLARFGELATAGADALTMLQDLAELTHLLTRGKLVPELATDPALSEIDRAALQRLAPRHTTQGLARLWQILLKAIGEVQAAPRPLLAAEMALVRLCYAATLPTPGELLEKFPNAAMASNAPPAAPEGGGANFNDGPAQSGPAIPPAPRALKVVGGGMVQPLAPAIAAAALQPATQTEPSISARLNPLSLDLASDYRKLVQLFLAKKEVTLHAELYGNARLVALAPGRLELEPLPGAPRDLASRAAARLSDWTGDRWIVAIARNATTSPGTAQPTLAEAERDREATLRQEALDAPLVRAALAAFPGATLLGIKPRALKAQAQVEAEAAGGDPAPSDVELTAEDILPPSTTGFDALPDDDIPPPDE